MRFALIGGTRRGCELLARLLREGHVPCGVVVLEQDAHETDRCESEIEDLCREADIPSRRARRMDETGWRHLIAKEWAADLALIVGCRILLPLEHFEDLRLGALAVHDSLLPDGRGFAPSNWALLRRADRTGVSLFALSERMDEGPVVLRQECAVLQDMSIPELHREICRATENVVLRFLSDPEGHLARAEEQSEEDATYGCSRTPRDGLLDWTRPASEIVRTIRALEHPWPGAFTHLGSERLRIWKAKESPDARKWAGRVPGRVVAFSRSEGWVDVLAGAGTVRIETLEIDGDGRGARPASEVLRSVRATLGLGEAECFDRLAALEARIARLELAQRGEEK